MRLWRSRQPASSVEADRFDAASEVLRRWSTRGSSQSLTYRRRREARQRQQQRAGAQPHPPTEASQSRSSTSRSAAAQRTGVETVLTPQAPAPSAEPVPSVAPAPVPAPKTADELAYEHFLAFETLCGNGDRIAERIEEARSYEPEDPPPDYVW